MIALLLAATILAAPAPKKHDAAHAAAHRSMAIPSWTFGGFVSRDLEDGPTLIGPEIIGRSGSFGARMSIAAGDHVTRFTGDALYFGCPKPIQWYAGVGMVFDCVDHEPPTPRAPDPPPAPRDPPSLIFGLQSRGRTSLFFEVRPIFGPDPVTAAWLGLRRKP